jgi:hypothetical protein
MLPRSLRRYRFKWKYLALLAVFSVGMYFFFNHDNSQIRNDELLAFRKKRYVEYKNSESKRTGPGEGGKAVNLEGEEKILGEKLYKKEAFNIIASDKISLQRSVPDVRDARLVEKYEYKNVHHTCVKTCFYFFIAKTGRLIFFSYSNDDIMCDIL